MTEDQILVHVTQLHDTRQKRKAKEEEVVVAMKKDVGSVQAKAFAKVVDNTIISGVIIDLTNTGVTDKTLKASNVAIADELEHNNIEPTSKQSTTSNEATSRNKGQPDIFIVYSTSFSHTHIDYA